MTLEPKKVSLALAETAGVMYALCAVVVAISPKFAVTLLGWIAHLGDLSQLTRKMTLSGFVMGLVIIFIYFYVGGWVFAALYNRLHR